MCRLFVLNCWSRFQEYGKFQAIFNLGDMCRMSLVLLVFLKASNLRQIVDALIISCGISLSRRKEQVES
jgi:hypothetical protein